MSILTPRSAAPPRLRQKTGFGGVSGAWNADRPWVEQTKKRLKHFSNIGCEKAWQAGAVTTLCTHGPTSESLTGDTRRRIARSMRLRHSPAWPICADPRQSPDRCSGATGAHGRTRGSTFARPEFHSRRRFRARTRNATQLPESPSRASETALHNVKNRGSAPTTPKRGNPSEIPLGARFASGKRRRASLHGGWEVRARLDMAPGRAGRVAGAPTAALLLRIRFPLFPKFASGPEPLAPVLRSRVSAARQLPGEKPAGKLLNLSHCTNFADSSQKTLRIRSESSESARCRRLRLAMA
jgi:hypothetical protein